MNKVFGKLCRARVIMRRAGGANETVGSMMGIGSLLGCRTLFWKEWQGNMTRKGKKVAVEGEQCGNVVDDGVGRGVVYGDGEGVWVHVRVDT